MSQMSQVLKMSEAGSIGVHAMILLTVHSPGTVRVRTIADEFSVSEAHCSKVMQRFVKSGMVQAIRGPKGGFRLAVSPDETTILDVYEAIDGKLEDRHCFFQVQKCESGCVFGPLMRNLNQQVREHFSSMTLSRAAEELAGRNMYGS